MTIVRTLARTMLASYFVANGVRAWRHPEDFTEAAQPAAEKLLPVATAVLPRPVAVYLPSDARELARTTAAAQIIGGVALATGFGRRLGAGVLATSLLPSLLVANPLKGPAPHREETLALLSKNVGLLGGVLLAAMDTEGRPNLAWRAKAQKEALARQAARTKAEAQREAKLVAKRARRTAQATRQEIASVLS
jgi:uncharacterized membrane protein YphA (DoxX/SURF4 family)